MTWGFNLAVFSNLSNQFLKFFHFFLRAPASNFPVPSGTGIKYTILFKFVKCSFEKNQYFSQIGTLRQEGFRAMHDQLTQLDRGRCKAPAPWYFYKNGKLGLPRCRWLSPAAEFEGAQPSCSFSLRRRFQPLTDEKRSFESRRDSVLPQGFHRSSRTW